MTTDKWTLSDHWSLVEEYDRRLRGVIEERLQIKVPDVFQPITWEIFAEKNGIDTRTLWSDFIKEKTGLTAEEYRTIVSEAIESSVTHFGDILKQVVDKK